MKHVRIGIATLFCLLLCCEQKGSAQRPSGQGRNGNQGMRGAGGQGGQNSPLLRTFDADQNNELSASEIANASAVLKNLDRNRDVKLAADESRQSGGRGRSGQGAGRQNTPVGGRGVRARGHRNGIGEPPGRGNGVRQGNPARADTSFADQLITLNETKDGSLSLEELPVHLQRPFAASDANADG